MTIVLVLGLIAITLALAYAMIRTQSVSARLQDNHERERLARQAAIAGLHIAIRKMHDVDWEGVDAVLSGSLGEYRSYRATYATGDPSLTEDSPQYAEYPYRVTVQSTGYCSDPGNPTIRAERTATAVLQLVRRQLSTPPANWTSLQQFDDDHPYTVCQWADDPVALEVPSRIEGPVHFRGPLELCRNYPEVDNRPFDGVIDEVAVFNKALSESELDDIHLAGRLGWSSWMATLYASHGPVGWWRFDEDSGERVATDSAGGNDGTYRGAAAGAGGLPGIGAGRAARFDGYNDYVGMGTFDLSGEEITLLGWFKADSFAETDSRIISKAIGYDPQEHLWLLGTCRKGSSIRLRFRLRTGGVTKTLEANAGDIFPGQWVFAAAVYDGQKMRLYCNADEVADEGQTGSVGQDPAAMVWVGDNPPGSARSRYLRDLKAMAEATGEDWRPLSGPVYLPAGGSNERDVSLVQDDLQVPVVDVPASSGSPLDSPGEVTTYRLYPGGKAYDVPALSSDISGDIFEPDPVENPLGVFRAPGTLRVYDGASITGVVLATNSANDLYIEGDNILLRGADLPEVEGASDAVQLPAVIVGDDLRVRSGTADSSVEGMVVSFDELEVQSGSQDDSFTVRGRVLAGKLSLRGRTEWDEDVGTWLIWLKQFLAQLDDGDVLEHFPAWLDANVGRDPRPNIAIRPPELPTSYHWHNWDDPLFQPHPNDEGLVWELIEWRDASQ